MRELQRQLPTPALRFVSFSVDPAHDSVEVLRRYADYWAKDESRWHLLRTEPASLQTVLDGMRVIARPQPVVENPILHTSLFFVVDPAGHVRGMFDGEDPRARAQLVADVSNALGVQPEPQSTPEPAPRSATDSEPPRATATDPVCGMQVRVADAVLTVHWDGHDYHFCSESCRDSFLSTHEGRESALRHVPGDAP
jgi:YHS domain-containing protein